MNIIELEHNFGIVDSICMNIVILQIIINRFAGRYYVKVWDSIGGKFNSNLLVSIQVVVIDLHAYSYTSTYILYPVVGQIQVHSLLYSILIIIRYFQDCRLSLVRGT